MKQLSILETAMLVGAENHLNLTNIRSLGEMPAQLYDIILKIKEWRNTPEGEETIHSVSDGT
jgi:hypothetical protein